MFSTASLSGSRVFFQSISVSVADKKMTNTATSEGKHKMSPRRSPKESSGQGVTSEGPMSQTADPNSSADIFALSPATSKRSSGIHKRGVKRRAGSPPLSSTSPVVPQSSPASPRSSRKTSRLLFPNAQSRPKGSEPIYSSSGEWEPKLGSSPAQTTPSPSPVSRKSQTPPEKPRTVRPTPETRTASAPTPLTSGSGVSSGIEVKRAQYIDGDIERQIRHPKKLSKKDKELAYVYVVPAEIDGKKLIKIGHTTEASVITRIKGIVTGKCCNTIQILPLEDKSREHIQIHLFYEQVEKLAHKELANFRHDFICLCGKRHEEYFAVDEDIGHMVVERWARLCALRPFDKDFALTDKWKFHLKRFRGRNHGRPNEKQHEKEDDHLSRHQRWESFLASNRWHWWLYRTRIFIGKGWTHRWQIWSLVLASLLAIFTRSWWSSYPLFITLGAIPLV
ncbi:hypothetical protein V8F06_013328 [Rhypophila decipiens]